MDLARLMRCTVCDHPLTSGVRVVSHQIHTQWELFGELVQRRQLKCPGIVRATRVAH